jgi:putative ABC transport system permease protein
MLFYNVRIAFKSFRRNPVLSLITLVGIALGVGVSTLFSTIHHSMAKDPLPGRSGSLYYVRLDSWDPLKPYPGDDPTRPPMQITYRDMVGIMKSELPVHQTGAFRTSLTLTPEGGEARPLRVDARLCFADFFPMFDVPFRYGTGWDKKADAGPEQVAVINEETNERLFGGRDSVGKTLRLEGRDFKIVGVLDHWRPTVKFYDITNIPVAPPEAVFVPFGLLRPLNLQTSGNSDGWGPSAGPGIEGRLASETCWIQMWVELPSEHELLAYQDFLKAYVLEQKKTGRFPRPVNNRVTPMMAWIDEQKVVPPEVRGMMLVSLLFLAVCALNLMGLLLGKFLARSAEVGVRRALGARRIDIFAQHVLECEVMGVLGGAFGLALAALGIVWLNNFVKTLVTFGDMFRIDLPMALLAVALSLAAGLIAGVYPAWRVCRIAPAVHLKLQ